jgi:hypothetical protein
MAKDKSVDPVETGSKKMCEQDISRDVSSIISPTIRDLEKCLDLM